MAPPRPSPSTWISMWRGFCRYFSRYTEASPNADLASLPAVDSAIIRSSAGCATFLPRPPARAPAAGRRFHQYRKADCLRDRYRVVVGTDAAVGARHHGDAELLCGLLG